MSPNVAVRTHHFSEAVDSYTNALGFQNRSGDPDLADLDASPLNLFVIEDPEIRGPGMELFVRHRRQRPLGGAGRHPSGRAQSPMFYDYYGFPQEAYSITYPAPGHPALADRIAGLLKENDIPARIDDQRDFDHGLFIPLKLMYPEADIPSIQLSLLRGLNSAAHIAPDRALRGLVNENLLSIGSGFSFQNLNAFSEGLLARPTRPTTPSRAGSSRPAPAPCPRRSAKDA